MTSSRPSIGCVPCEVGTVTENRNGPPCATGLSSVPKSRSRMPAARAFLTRRVYSFGTSGTLGTLEPWNLFLPFDMHGTHVAVGLSVGPVVPVGLDLVV